MPLVPNTLSQGSGIPAIGTILSLGNLGSPQVYNAVGNQGNVKWDPKNKHAETTNMGTAWTQFIPTISDGGSVTGEFHFIPGSSGSDGLTALEGHSFSSGLGYIFKNRQTRQWKLTFPDGTVEAFDAFITDFSIDASVDKDLMLHITLQVTGQPTTI